jgi:large subunit ribosomal protein L10
MKETTFQTKVRPEKQQAVAEIRERLERSSAVLLTEYRGLKVSELAQLRRALAGAGVEYRVVKNTLTRLATRELGIEGLDELFEGPTALAYCFSDPVTGAKALAGFARDHPALVIKGGLLDNRPLDADAAKGLATVDPLEVSLAKICGGLTSPLSAIAATLEAPLSQIAYVLKTLGERAA